MLKDDQSRVKYLQHPLTSPTLHDSLDDEGFATRLRKLSSLDNGSGLRLGLTSKSQCFTIINHKSTGDNDDEGPATMTFKVVKQICIKDSICFTKQHIVGSINRLHKSDQTAINVALPSFHATITPE